MQVQGKGDVRFVLRVRRVGSGFAVLDELLVRGGHGGDLDIELRINFVGFLKLEVVFVLFLLRFSQLVVHHFQVPLEGGHDVFFVQAFVSLAAQLEADLEELLPFLERDALVPLHLLRDLCVFGQQIVVRLAQIRDLLAQRR